MSELYMKHSYLNNDIPYLISNEIVEYDMQSAGFNLVKKFKLLSDEKIQILQTMGKKTRQREIGLEIRNNKEFGKTLSEKFVEARKWFFKANQIKDDQVLSIKKDAIVCLTRCLHTEWDNIHFNEKNIYSSYYYMNDCEFYYNRDTLDVKGISDDLLELHRDYMLEFIHSFARMNELIKRERIIKFLKDFATHYKNRDLDINFYRELNKQSLFRINEKIGKRNLGVRDYGIKENLNIDHNYMKYLVPMISILT